MKLNEQQIQQLFDFTRRHYVEYYDVQAELVDHLANAIEARKAENPSLVFEHALQAEFKKFGIFGFMDVVEKRQIALTRKYHKMIWTHFIGFFRLPKIVLSVMMVFIVFNGLKFIVFKEEAFMAALAVLTLILLVKMTFETIRRAAKIKRKKEKRWLFEEIINGYGSFTSVLVLPLQLINLFYRKSVFHNEAALWIASLFIVIYALICYIILKIIPSKGNEYLHKMYPDYSTAEV